MRKLRDIVANRKIIAVQETQSVLEAAKLMSGLRVGTVMVVSDKKLQGILSERDIITRVVVPGLDPEDVPVSEVMTRDPVFMSPDKPFSHALLLMANGGFRHLPVIEAGEVVGIVSMRDSIGSEHEEMDRLMVRYEHLSQSNWLEQRCSTTAAR